MPQTEKTVAAEPRYGRAESLSDSGGDTFLKEEKKLIRKLDWKLLPIVTILYLLSFLDRSNVANARIEGLTTDLGMTPDQYLTGLTLFFVGYILFEVPCNIILRRTTPKFWLPTLTVLWGIVATLQGIVQNLAGFFIVRFFLGVTEGGLFPGVVFYLSMWYKRRERQLRISLFFSAASLAGAFGGILAYGIAHMKGVGGVNGWRWIFILEGILTVLVALTGYIFVANYPSTVRWLSDHERSLIHRRLKDDSDVTNNEGFTWRNVASALKDYRVWLYCLAFHTMSLPLYTLSLFLPSIIKALGYTAAGAQLLTVPPYALATILTLTIAYTSERLNIRTPFIALSSSFAAIGYILLLANTSPTTHPGISYVGTFFAAGGIYPSTALSLSLPAINVSGQTKRAVAAALQISIGNLGAVMGTQLYRNEDSPRYIVGHAVALGYLVGNICIACLLRYVLMKDNRRREQLETQHDVADELSWKGDDDVRWRFSA